MPKKLPKEVIEHWPEIFGDIDVNVIPIEYLASIKVSFHDETVWDIDLDGRGKSSAEDIELMLEELFDEYCDEIKSLDFRLNTDKVKRDITKRTSRFLKKRK